MIKSLNIISHEYSLYDSLSNLYYRGYLHASDSYEILLHGSIAYEKLTHMMPLVCEDEP